MEWEVAVIEYSLQQKQYAKQMYEKIKMWTSAYLWDKFYVVFRTTSRCEGINSFINRIFKSTDTILELVTNLELVLHEYKNKEMLFHFNSMNKYPVMTTCLRSIEMNIAMMYTREVFNDVKKEIEGTEAVNLLGKRRCLKTMVYTMEE
ncbi:hypothetical protein Ahy_B01g053115 [Arachis hypogaea]|uniref:Protein FAR1-RELATED SEQUENCE n=1 Tax=Arachis hypogaea TaxID=3818 RepID=A0A445AR32_ARAHY|nr:hypothetical protein Ahy_B01g053115 [Arachis hypogaea]